MRSAAQQGAADLIVSEVEMNIEISTTIGIREAGFDEIWLQDQIWENPNCLGLGELENVTKEKAVSSGGWLDILLKNPIDDAMYEVEVMLGDTDPSHIIRTIEYWDLIKRKWPQRQHFAVLVAERITKRFFNVIQILSNTVPLIAVQVNIIKSQNGMSLHFTKILDVYEEPDDDVSGGNESFDESYWAKRSDATLNATKELLKLTGDIYDGASLGFNKYSLTINANGYNQMVVRLRSGKSVLISLRYGSKRTEIETVLEEMEVQYTDKRKQFFFQIPTKRIDDLKEGFRKIATLNKEWWNS